MALVIEGVLFCDPQDAKPVGYCDVCGGALYEYGERCACAQRPFATLAELAEGYREAAVPLRQRLHQLRQMLLQTEDPEQLWHIRRRIAELTPMLTQMNELAELTAHYYDRGYWRSEKYTL